MEEIVAYGLALLIGVVMGMIGGGGSILTVPVFVYLLSMDEEPATACSLFVVGLVAFVGGIRYLSKKQVDLMAAVAFLIPSVPAVYLTRKYLVQAIPEVIFSTDSVVFTRGTFMMLLFALVMIVAAISMLRNHKNKLAQEGEGLFSAKPSDYVKIVIEGAVVGVITGLIGAGGGFLIVPALVVFAKIPMRIAVGTSLVIIAAKSLIGFLGDLGQGYPIDWEFLILFSIIAIIGLLSGVFFSGYVSSKQLKKGFGWFVLAMAVVILLIELI